MKRQVLTVLAFGVLVFGASSASSFAQSRPAAGRGTRTPAPTAPAPARRAAPAPAPAPAPVPAASPAPVPVPVPVATSGDAGATKDSRVTIALFGEGNVPGAESWMRSVIASTFEDQLVKTRRFRVVSQAAKWISDGNAAGSTNGLYDPNEVIRLGRQVQAKYALVLRPTQLQVNKKGTWKLAWSELEVGIQAQVINTESNVISESVTFKETVKTGLKPDNPNVKFIESDFGKPFGEAINKFALNFISTVVTREMPLETVVADVAPGEVILAAGSDIGLDTDAEFEVFEERALTLPNGTKTVRTTKMARLTVVRVEPLLAYTRITETYGDGSTRDTSAQPERVKVGMLARYAVLGAKTKGKK